MHNEAFLFVHTIQKKFWLGMLAAIDAALISAARRPPGTDAEFMRFLIATREYLLSEGRERPEGMPDDAFVLLKPLCEHLVSQGRFPHSRLQLFSGLDPWYVGVLPESLHTGAPSERKDGV